MKKNKKKNKNYFTEDTENYIVLFNNTENINKRNEIYSNHIHVPFQTIVRGILRRHKFEYIDLDIEDLESELLAKLFKELPMYGKNNGKAYSYFSVICKFYLIQKNDKAYLELKRKREVDTIDAERLVMNEISRNDRIGVIREFMDEFINHMDSNIYTIFKNENDIKIADSILEIFRNRHLIEDYNKKALYLLIRNRTGLDTANISNVVNIMHEYYDRLYKNFLRTGDIEVSGSFW